MEDNPDDVELALRAFKKYKIMNDVIVVNDGTEALDYLFGKGKYAGRDMSKLPEVVLLDLKLDVMNGYKFGANSYVQKPVDFTQFSEAVGRLGIYWLLLNKSPDKQGERP